MFCLIDQTFRKVLFSLLNYELSTEWTIVPGELTIPLIMLDPVETDFKSLTHIDLDLILDVGATFMYFNTLKHP